MAGVKELVEACEMAGVACAGEAVASDVDVFRCEVVAVDDA